MILHDCLLAIHLLGLCFAVLQALRADLYLLKSTFGVSNKTPQDSRSICIGFAMLCISGGGLVFFYAMTGTGILMNPKLWAKVLIVSIAGINGAWIENSLLRQTTSAPRIFFAVAVSLISWVGAFTLGVCKTLNFTTNFFSMIAIYLCSIFIFFVVIYAAYNAIELSKSKRFPYKKLSKTSVHNLL